MDQEAKEKHLFQVRQFTLITLPEPDQEEDEAEEQPPEEDECPDLFLPEVHLSRVAFDQLLEDLFPNSVPLPI